VCSFFYERLLDGDCQRWASIWRYQLKELCGLCAGILPMHEDEISHCINCGLQYHSECWKAVRKICSMQETLCTHCSLNRFRIEESKFEEKNIGFKHSLKWYEIHPHFLLYANRSKSIRFILLNELKNNFSKDSTHILNELHHRLECKRLSESHEVQAVCRDIIISGMKKPLILSFTYAQEILKLESGFAEFAAALLLEMIYVPIRIRLYTTASSEIGFDLVTPNRIPANGITQRGPYEGCGEHPTDPFVEVDYFGFSIQSLNDLRHDYDQILQSQLSDNAKEWRHRCVNEVTRKMNVKSST